MYECVWKVTVMFVCIAVEWMVRVLWIVVESKKWTNDDTGRASLWAEVGLNGCGQSTLTCNRWVLVTTVVAGAPDYLDLCRASHDWGTHEILLRNGDPVTTCTSTLHYCLPCLNWTIPTVMNFSNAPMNIDMARIEYLDCRTILTSMFTSTTCFCE